jgi:LPS sulfotransferase NodH
MSDIRAFIRKEIITILKENQQKQGVSSDKENQQKQGVSSDVAAVTKVSASNKSLQTAQKRIDNLPEFEQAFKEWFSQLGLKPGKVSSAGVRDKVGKVLQQLGYK